MNSSAKVHPTLHISTLSPYNFAPYNISGGLYNLVTTLPLNSLFGDPVYLEIPKSPIITVPSLLK